MTIGSIITTSEQNGNYRPDVIVWRQYTYPLHEASQKVTVLAYTLGEKAT